MFIVYEGDDEVFVTTPQNELEALKEWFEDGGRSVDDYDRIVSTENAIRISSKLQLEVGV